MGFTLTAPVGPNPEVDVGLGYLSDSDFEEEAEGPEEQPNDSDLDFVVSDEDYYSCDSEYFPPEGEDEDEDEYKEEEEEEEDEDEELFFRRGGQRSRRRVKIQCNITINRTQKPQTDLEHSPPPGIVIG